MRIIKLLFVLCAFLFFLIVFLQIPVYDYDFWWHLANGKYIIENKTLPQYDPFSYTTSDTASDRKSLILKGYWLAQIIFYEVFSIWDLKGILLLRSVLLLAFLLFVFLSVKKQNVSDLVSVGITFGVFQIALIFSGERPQLFNFLVFAVVYYLLEDFRLRGTKKIFFIPFLLVLLSNMHIGYISCVLLISVYTFAYVLQFVFKKNINFKKFLFIWVLSIVFSSVLNPNGFIIYKEIFFLKKYTSAIIESMPTFYLFSQNIQPLIYSYIIFLAVSVLALRYFKKLNLVHIFLLIVFTLMSLVSARYLIFYMCISAPILANLLTCLSREKIFNRQIKFLNKKENILVFFALIICIFLILKTGTLFKKNGYEETFLATPKSTADFLSNIELKGNMFNEYGFGGYLIWRLYPEHKVFIDGRSLEYEVLVDYDMIAAADKGWEDKIKKYKINYLVMPALTPHGEIYHINEKLLGSNEWILIYNDHLSLIFLRNDIINKNIINEFRKDKREAVNTILMQAYAGAMLNKQNIRYTVTAGKMLVKLGKLHEAEGAFRIALKKDPNNSNIKELLQMIERIKEKR